MGYWILNDTLWIKLNPMPNFRGVRFTNAHETLLWAQKEKGARYTFNYQASKSMNEDLQMRSDWTFPICSGRERLKVNGQKAHPTQKPEALLYRVLLATSNPGDVVLDPFFGTGTTGAVARRLQRHFIGIEKNPFYVDLARQRIDAVRQYDFDPAVFALTSPRRLERIPFGLLLENDYLEPGELLYFGPSPELTARLMSDGSLEFRGQRGSIHQIARLIRQGPCNGWEVWCYRDSATGRLESIDRLRQEIRRLNSDSNRKREE
jgi:modification methylase